MSATPTASALEAVRCLLPPRTSPRSWVQQVVGSNPAAANY
jgi:hypothetical protein